MSETDVKAAWHLGIPGGVGPGSAPVAQPAAGNCAARPGIGHLAQSSRAQREPVVTVGAPCVRVSPVRDRPRGSRRPGLRPAGSLAVAESHTVQPDQLERVVAGLQELGFIARVHSLGVGRQCVRVVLPGGAEALWDADGAAGLEAQVMRDGMLVGYCPLIPGSADFTEEQIVLAIARAEYVGG